MGWVVPETTPDYVRPVRRLLMRLKKNNGQVGYAMLISTLQPCDVLRLIGQPLALLNNEQLVALAYAQFYDKRGGAIEIEIKEDKQGFGLTKRNKKRAAAQQMVMLLNSLAHNVLVWVQEWLAEQVPKLASFGTLRLVRDVLSVSGKIEINPKTSKLKRIVLNRAAPIMSKLLTAFRSLLLHEHAVVILGEI